MSGIEGFFDPNLLVGYETADDAAVYRLDDDLALVQTVDFFTPIVDDPFVYGQIAAANSLSDIYAMGATPRLALAVACFPEGDLDEDILREIFRGGAEKMKEARVAVAGGHTVKDPEIKFGYAVTGLARPDRVTSNRGARPGDRLLLTKPLGTGIVSTAVKYEKCPPALHSKAVEWMLLLNRQAAEILQSREVHAVTDVTGYGLLGHAYEIALHSGVRLNIHADRTPVLEGVEALARKGLLPGGIESNRRYVGRSIEIQGATPVQLQILFDPQTSGGLLISASPREADALREKCRQQGVFMEEIGDVSQRETSYLRVGKAG